MSQVNAYPGDVTGFIPVNLVTGASDCERIGDGFMAQPVSTVSALAYVAVGAWIVVRFQRRAARVFGLLVVLVGIGSIGFHGGDDDRVKFVHDLALPGVLLFIAGFELVHSRLAGVRFRIERRPAGYLVAAAAFAGGLTVRLLGETDGPLCAPGSVIQWHAVWHVATAVALGAWAWGALGPGSGELGGGEDEATEPDHAGDVRGDHIAAQARNLGAELPPKRVEVASGRDIGPADRRQMCHQRFRRSGANGPFEILEHVAANTIIDDHGFLLRSVVSRGKFASSIPTG